MQNQINENTTDKYLIPASIRESYELKLRMAGLLTYSPWPGLPARLLTDSDP